MSTLAKMPGAHRKQTPPILKIKGRSGGLKKGAPKPHPSLKQRADTEVPKSVHSHKNDRGSQTKTHPPKRERGRSKQISTLAKVARGSLSKTHLSQRHRANAEV